MSFLDIQRVFKTDNSPTDTQFIEWVNVALSKENKSCEVVIRIVDEAESATLNQQYRKKSSSTNILSFAYDAPENIELNLLGDLVICAPVVNREAQQQNKAVYDHWAHITIHGVLHLQGYDHTKEDEAEDMEAQEIAILKKFNIDNPYLQEHK